MIGNIIKGIEKSQIVLIEDSTDNPGRCVLACFVINLLQRVDEVHLVSFDLRSKELQRVVPPDLKTKLIVHNGHEDLLGWKESSALNVHSDLIKAVKGISVNKPDRKTAVVIDSISPLLIHRPVPYTCQTIHRLGCTDKLGTEVEQVVCLVHQDLHHNSSLMLVEHTASSIIKLTDSKSQQHKLCCNTLHKKISGKIHRSMEHFNITEQFDITDVTEVKTQASTLPKDSSPQIDPTADLTFNLSLTDKEKQARSQVKLPYTYNQQRQDETLTKSVGEGNIFYQPDEADDFDEEDPDDDLDI